MVQSVLTNHTGRGGVSAFPVVSPVVFRDLTLLYTYADGARSAVPLFDDAHMRRTDLDDAMFFLRSAAFPVRHPDHGYLVKVLLKGYFSTTLLQVRPSTTGGSFLAEIESDFGMTIKQPSTDSFATLYAMDFSGNRYPVGAFSMVEAVREADASEQLVLAR